MVASMIICDVCGKWHYVEKVEIADIADKHTWICVYCAIKAFKERISVVEHERDEAIQQRDEYLQELTLIKEKASTSNVVGAITILERIRDGIDSAQILAEKKDSDGKHELDGVVWEQFLDVQR